MTFCHQSAKIITRNYYEKSDWKVGQLDKFLGAFLHKNEKFSEFWEVCKIVFVLSHGQSAIDHGISVNKDLVVEIFGEQSLTRQCLVYDYFTSRDISIYEYVIPNNLVESCKVANSKCKTALEKKLDNAKASENDRKPKLKMDDIVEVKKKTKTLLHCVCIETLDKDIVLQYFEFEQKSDIKILIKATPLRKTVNEKKNLKNDLKKQLKTQRRSTKVLPNRYYQVFLFSAARIMF